MFFTKIIIISKDFGYFCGKFELTLINKLGYFSSSILDDREFEEKTNDQKIALNEQDNVLVIADSNYGNVRAINKRISKITGNIKAKFYKTKAYAKKPLPKGFVSFTDKIFDNKIISEVDRIIMELSDFNFGYMS
jgi:hypothetical protein